MILLEVAGTLKRLSEKCKKIADLDAQKAPRSQAFASELDSKIKAFYTDLDALQS